jgi:hypothetical protein
MAKEKKEMGREEWLADKRTIIIPAGESVAILAAAERFAMIDCNYGARRTNQYFPKFWRSPNHNHIWAGPGWDKKTIEITIEHEFYAPAQMMASLLATLGEIRAYVEYDYVVAAETAKNMYLVVSGRCVSPLGVSFTFYPTLRGAKSMAGKLGGTAYDLADGLKALATLRDDANAIIGRAVAAAVILGKKD